MKRTLLVTLDFPPMFGGVANYWANLNRHIPGDSFVVLAPEFDDSLDFDMKQNYLIYRDELISKSKWIWPKWLPLVWTTMKHVRRDKIEKILVTHVLPVGTIALFVKMVLRVPYIVSVHGLDIGLGSVNPRKKWLMKKVLSNAEAIVVNSNYTKSLIVDLKCCDENKIHIVYPCPNIVYKETPPEKLEALKTRHNLQDKKVILTIGRLIERKGHDKVIEAMPKILERVPNAYYIIIGQGVNRKHLIEMVESLNLKDKVKILTDIMDYELPGYLSVSDVFVMPCRELAHGDVEGFGIVYLEANSYGLPVIAGNSGGAPEAVENGVNGLVVDPLNTEDVADSIIKLLSDRELAKKMGEVGKQRVANNFTWSEQAKTIIKLLE